MAGTTHCRGTKKRRPLFAKDGGRIRGHDNQEAAEHAFVFKPLKASLLLESCFARSSDVLPKQGKEAVVAVFRGCVCARREIG
jgi:hypothetical protein